MVLNRSLESITADMGAFWHMITGDSQLRWIGPEKGVIHLATAAVVNAVWDLWAKVEQKPLWKLLSDMSPDELVRCIDFRYISDALTPDEARDLLRRQEATRAEREAEMLAQGFPAYTTSAGWIGYSDDKVRRLCQEAINAGFQHIKMKVGRDLDADRRRARLIREIIGPDRKLMADANQVWDVPQAIAWMRDLAEFDFWWIEEPTSPDDILGHAADRPRSRAGRRRYRRARAEPHYLQAAVAGKRHQFLSDRRLPPRWGERSAGSHPDGGEIRRAGLPACWRRRVVRICATSVDLGLYLRLRVAGESCD
jgi:L-fuconate dehydratase